MRYISANSVLWSTDASFVGAQTVSLAEWIVSIAKGVIGRTQWASEADKAFVEPRQVLNLPWWFPTVF